MNFKHAMARVANGKTVKVTPTSDENPFLVKVGMFEGLEADCLRCRCLTKDGTHLDPDCDWEVVCYLLCFNAYIDGEWEVVDADDYTYEEDDE